MGLGADVEDPESTVAAAEDEVSHIFLTGNEWWRIFASAFPLPLPAAALLLP